MIWSFWWVAGGAAFMTSQHQGTRRARFQALDGHHPDDRRGGICRFALASDAGMANAASGPCGANRIEMTPIKVKLPSGRVATLRSPIPDHPWEVVGEGSVFVLKRLKRGDSSVWETFANQGVQTPLCLNREDAEALAEILNEGKTSRPPDDARSVPL